MTLFCCSITAEPQEVPPPYCNLAAAESAKSGDTKEVEKGFPSQTGYPPKGYPPGPPQGYPPQAYPPQGYPPQGYPPQAYPPQGYPPQGYPPQGYPPQGYTPQARLDLNYNYKKRLLLFEAYQTNIPLYN